MISVCVVALALLGTFLIRPLILLSKSDGNWHRLWWIAISPVIVILVLPLIEHISRAMLKVSRGLFKHEKNSACWSGTPPSQIIAREAGYQPPPITILVPVYKEMLDAIIVPTISNILRAVGAYHEHGGRANIVVCDDGLQVIDEDERSERRNFYSSMDLSWVSRPKHGYKPSDTAQAFYRRGKFKFGSNLNNACNAASMIRQRYKETCKGLLTLRPSQREIHPDQIVHTLYQCEEIEAGLNWVGGSPLLGSVVVVIDSDCRVPTRFLPNVGLESFLNPQVDFFLYRRLQNRLRSISCKNNVSTDHLSHFRLWLVFIQVL
jgi:hypothetical protein